MTTKHDQSVRTGGYTEKLALVAGSLSALAMVPAGVQASIISGTEDFSITGSSGSPITIADWDIDSSGGGDITPTMSWGGSNYIGGINSTSFAAWNAVIGFGGGNFVAGLQAGSTNLGSITNPATLATMGSIYGFQNTQATTVTANNYTSVFNAASGPPYVGFSFVSGGDTLFGWLSLVSAAGNYDFVTGEVTVNYTVAYGYEACGTSIHTGDRTGGPTTCGNGSTIPEPPVNALMLLGLGAAGVARWRQGRKAAGAGAAA